jgi:hypothetical protein
VGVCRRFGTRAHKEKQTITAASILLESSQMRRAKGPRQGVLRNFVSFLRVGSRVVGIPTLVRLKKLLPGPQSESVGYKT